MTRAIIGIGGSGSGAGKTFAAARIISALVSEGLDVGAVKFVPDSLYTSINDDPETITTPGKDTALMKEAGAREVLLVRAPAMDLDEALETAIERLGTCDCVLVEGNSAVLALASEQENSIEVSLPCIVLFITDAKGAEPLLKESALRLLAVSDMVIHEGGPPPGTPEGATGFRRDEPEAYTAHLVSLLKGAL